MLVEKTIPVEEQQARPNILLIEDQSEFAHYVEKVLVDYAVTWARTLDEARLALQRRKYQLVLLDLGLPDTPDPRQTWQSLKEDIGDIPAIIVTGNPTTKSGETVEVIGKDPLWEDETVLPALVARLLVARSGGGHG